MVVVVVVVVVVVLHMNAATLSLLLLTFLGKTDQEKMQQMWKKTRSSMMQGLNTQTF